MPDARYDVYRATDGYIVACTYGKVEYVLHRLRSEEHAQRVASVYTQAYRLGKELEREAEEVVSE